MKRALITLTCVVLLSACSASPKQVNRVEIGTWIVDKRTGDWIHVEDYQQESDGSIVYTLRTNTNHRIEVTDSDLAKYYREP